MAEDVKKGKDGSLGKSENDTNALTSTRTGSATVVNSWGLTISELTLRHRRGNDDNKQEQKTYYAIAPDSRTEPMSFTYQTGAGSPFDYWWVIFVTIAGETWTCKDDFYCYVAAEDDGNVTLQLRGDKKDMYVTFSRSSSCTVGLHKQ